MLALKRCWLFTSFVLVAASHPASAQAPTPADGPWAGWAQCQLTAQFDGPDQAYLYQQVHTWLLTGATPLPASTASIRQFAATWQVTGQGMRRRGRLPVEQWTTAGQPMPDTLAIRMTLEGNVRIGGSAQLRSVGSTTSALFPYIDEWPLPVIEGAATQTSISNSVQQGGTNFPGQPAGSTSTVACSWNFVRGGGVPPPPPPVLFAGGSPSTPTGPLVLTTPTPTAPPRTITRDQAAPQGPLAGAIAAGTSAPASSPTPAGGTPTLSPASPTTRTGVLVDQTPGGTPTVYTQKDPTGFRADQIDDGTVKLTWTAAFGVGTYMLGGPGTNNGVQVTGTTYTVKGIAAGTQTWTIASLPVVTPFDQWPKATASVVSPFAGVAAAGVSTTTTTPVLVSKAFTTSGTFTVPNGVSRVIVELWGAGAGGSGGPEPGHGGGGGAYTRIVVAVSPGSSLGVVIGAGGAGGPVSRPTADGTDGSKTQLTQQGDVLAEADGGKADGTGGRKSSASGVQAQAGLAGQPPKNVYIRTESQGSILDHIEPGAGGGAVVGSVTPVGTTGGGGGSSQNVCPVPTSLSGLLNQSNCRNEPWPGGVGLPGYALISY